MKEYNICVGDHEFVKNVALDTTTNRMHALRITNLEIAQKVATAAAKILKKPTIIDEFNINSAQDLLDFIGNELEHACGTWAADIDISYDKDRIAVFHPDGRRTYKIQITTEYAD